MCQALSVALDWRDDNCRVYTKGARFYDLIQTGRRVAKDYGAEAAELDALIRSRNPGARTLLDVACGTGQHLSFLRNRYAVEGADLSRAMLTVARERLPGVDLHLIDMRFLDLGKRFDAVTCLFSSIGYLEPSEIRPTLQRFVHHLADGGVLVIDGWVRPDAWMDGHEPPIEHVTDGDVDLFRLDHSFREGSATTIAMHHLVRSARGIVHFAESHRLWLVPTSDLVAAIESAGLRTEVVHDSMPGRDRVLGVRVRQ